MYHGASQIDGERFATVSKAYDGPEQPSSIVAEIAAALFAFDFCAELCRQLEMQSLAPPAAVRVLSDNLEVCQTYRGERTARQYLSLWRPIFDACEALDEADVEHAVVKVRAHVNIPGNEKADRLARRASKRLAKGGRLRSKKHTLIRCLLPGCGGGGHMETAEDLAEHFCEFHCDREAADGFECALCDRTFRSSRRLQKHYDEDHQAVYSDDEEEDSDDESDEDDYTDYSDDDYSDNENEEEEESEDEDELSGGSCCSGYESSDDGGTTSTESDVTTTDGGGTTTSDSDITTTDDSTGTTTGGSSNSGTETVETDESEYECCYGDFCTADLDEMVNHWWNTYGVWTDGRVLECDYCDIVFPNEADRRTHLWQWHGVRSGSSSRR